MWMQVRMPCYIVRMLLRPYRRTRSLRRSWLRLGIFVVLAALLVDPIFTIGTNPPSRPTLSSASTIDLTTRQDRIFIVSMHWNNEMIIQSYWSAAVLDLVRHFGAENVYIFVMKIGSWNNTKGAFRALNLSIGETGSRKEY